MSNKSFEAFKAERGWVKPDGETDPQMKDIGWELAMQYDATAQTFGYLQRLIAGEGNALPFAPPCVKIVIAKEAWKEDYAYVYGFPKSDETLGQPHAQPPFAIRYPEYAHSFRIYYGANYGEGGYKRVETSEPLNPEVAARLEAGEFTDEEAEQLTDRIIEMSQIYWDLNAAARNPELNPDFAERVNETFYRDSSF